MYCRNIISIFLLGFDKKTFGFTKKADIIKIVGCCSSGLHSQLFDTKKQSQLVVGEIY